MTDASEARGVRFAHLMGLADPDIPLDEAMFLIAAHAHPDLDVDEEMQRLDDLADGCEPSFEAVWRRLFVEAGFSGEPQAFVDPSGSYLDTAIERRTGLPITLVVLTMEVARRAGIVVEGVGMPYHFLARYAGSNPVLFDPFHRGARLEEDEAADLFRASAGPDATLHPSHLSAANKQQILTRVLANIRAAYLAREDRRSMAWVLRLKISIPGAPLADHAQLAGVLAALGQAREAADLLDGLASRLPVDARQRALRKAELLRSTLN